MNERHHFIHHGNLRRIGFGRKLYADAADGVDVVRTSVRPYHGRHLHTHKEIIKTLLFIIIQLFPLDDKASRLRVGHYEADDSRERKETGDDYLVNDWSAW